MSLIFCLSSNDWLTDLEILDLSQKSAIYSDVPSKSNGQHLEEPLLLRQCEILREYGYRASYSILTNGIPLRTYVYVTEFRGSPGYWGLGAM